MKAKQSKWDIEVSASNTINAEADTLGEVITILEKCNPGARCSIARISDNTVFFEGTVEDVIVEINYSAAAAALGRKGGKVKTAAKAKAARENGRKGGRPKGSGKKKKEYDR